MLIIIIGLLLVLWFSILLAGMLFEALMPLFYLFPILCGTLLYLCLSIKKYIFIVRNRKRFHL